MKPKIDSKTYDRISEAISTWNMETIEPAVCELLYALGEDATLLDAIFDGDARTAICVAIDLALGDIDTKIARHEAKE